MDKNENWECFMTKARWNVYNRNLFSINNFKYSCFKFKFKMEKQIHQEEFVEFIDKNKPLLPWDVCNFFNERNIPFSLHYRYTIELSLKDNWILLKTVIYLKNQILKNKLKSKIRNYKIISMIEKDNNKKIKGFSIKILNIRKKTIHFILMDKNFCWKPKKILNNCEEWDSTILHWLCIQLGRISYKNFK